MCETKIKLLHINSPLIGTRELHGSRAFLLSTDFQSEKLELKVKKFQLNEKREHMQLISLRVQFNINSSLHTTWYNFQSLISSLR